MSRLLWPALALALAGCAPPDDSGAWFDDQASERGIDFEHVSGYSGRPLLPEIVGGGAALVDVDGDGDLDAYLVQSGNALSGGDPSGLGDRLYLNRGDGTFEAAPDSGADTGYGMGVAAGDYDNDGDVDLYVTNVGRNALLRNDGAGRFENVARQAGVADPDWGTAAAFLDFDLDGDLDLFVVNYMHWSTATEKECRSRGSLTYCSPTSYAAPAMDRLFRNDGDGAFADVTVDAGLAAAFGNGLGLAAADFDGDARLDVFVANDRLVNQLWLNRTPPGGALRFEESAVAWGCSVDDHGTAKAGMGVAAGDVDDDGDTDLLVVNLEGETDSFFRNDGVYFTDATAAAGLSAPGRRHTRFGVVLADFDNDSLLDLYEANGKVDGDAAQAVDAFAEPNLLLRGERGGRFAVVSPPGGTPAPLVHTSRGVAAGDVDSDGGVDLLVVNRDAGAYLLMNRTPARGNWARFDVRDGRRAAHGARLSATVGGRRISRVVQPSSSYLASHDPRVHVGLGAAEVAESVTVWWPGAAADDEEAFGDFPGGATATLRRGEGRQLAQDGAGR